MLAAIFNFLGGAAFRMIWGEVSSWLNKKLDHEHEIERMKLQGDLEEANSKRQESLIRLQSELGVKQIEVKGEVEADKAAGEAFTAAMQNFKPTGIKGVDAWNACIRPSAATVALLLWIMELVIAGFALTEWDRELMGSILGFYFADRSLRHRGK